MIITFCGHHDFISNLELERKMIDIISSFVKEKQTVEFYCVGYGHFDSFANNCVSRVKGRYPKIKSFLIVPYKSEDYLKNLEFVLKAYDDIVYPPIDEEPLKFAISKRNEWMVDQADIVIAYVDHDWSGAWTTLQYAKRKKKTVINLAE